jgi:hypothetical protein
VTDEAQWTLPAAHSEQSDDALFDRLASICRRIAEGYYNSDEVLSAVARRISENGVLDRRGGVIPDAR